MRGAALLLLLLAACGRPSAPPEPTPEEIGGELAKYPQVLVPLSTKSLTGLDEAAARLGGVRNVTMADFAQSYRLIELPLAGRPTPVMIAYSNPWLTPADTLAQPMSIPQFFRVFAAETDAAAVVFVAPQGQIVVAREKAMPVRLKILELGVSGADLPFSLVRGSLR